MDTNIGKYLKGRIGLKKEPAYIVFPHACTGNIQEAIGVLEEYPVIKAIPLTTEMIASGAFDHLVDLFCEEFYDICIKAIKHDIKKGRLEPKELDTFDMERARKFLREPLNLSFMMVRKGYADAEVGGTDIVEHARKSMRIIGQASDKNIVCSITIEFNTPRKFEDKKGGVIREQRFLTITDPAIGRPAMEYSFLSAGKILSKLLENEHISKEVYEQGLADIAKEKREYVKLKIDQALSAMRWHYALTGESPVGVFITHSTGGSDEHSPYIHLIREDIIPGIEKALEKAKETDRYLKHASFISQECQVETASDPRIKGTGVNDSHIGFANVHVCNSIVSANQHYKTFVAFGAISSTTCWSGFKKPVFDVPKNSPVNEIVMSSIIAAIQAKSEPEKKKEDLCIMAKELFNKLHSYNILAINPGSTSTKIALFHNREHLFTENIDHSGEENIPSVDDFEDHVAYRMRAIENVLKEKNCNYEEFSCIMGRGGLVRALDKAGVYKVNDLMLDDLGKAKRGVHASNFGAAIAHKIAQKSNCEAYIADPVVIDEQSIHAKVRGIKGVYKQPRWHALNQKYVARLWAEKNKKNYFESNIIVAHLGGGISVGAHHYGRVVDVNDALNGDGVFAINRSGNITPAQTLELLEQYSKKEIYELITRKGGFKSLLGTQDFREIMDKATHGDREASTYYNAFVYQFSKQICSLIPAFYPEKIDQLIFTGGIAKSNIFIEDVIRHLPKFIGMKCTVYPGEFEMEALAYNGLMVMRGIEEVREY